MFIDNDMRGPHTIKSFEVFDRASSGSGGSRRAEVADVLADKGVVSDAEGDGVLELCANGESRRHRMPQRDREWRVSTRAAQKHLASGNDAHDRIVHVPDNRAIVDEE